jgi:hypothetical protein
MMKTFALTVEKFAFYPVAIISSMMAAAAWSYQSRVVAAAATLVGLALWIAPLVKRWQLVARIAFWISFAEVFTLLAWALLWIAGYYV